MKIFNVVLLRQDEANGVVEAKAFPCIDYNVASKLQNELIQDELKNNGDWVKPSEEEMKLNKITLISDYSSDFYEVKIEVHDLIEI